jgi:S1-C subfamily serine protease
VQPGNSGGPVFDKAGNVIGVVCAKHRDAENVGYAIKANYVKNLIEMLPESITLPQTNVLVGKSLPEQVKLASKAVCVIIVNDD